MQGARENGTHSTGDKGENDIKEQAKEQRNQGREGELGKEKGG